MKKAIAELAVLVVAFFVILFVFQMADWVSILKVEKISKKTEEKLGDTFWELFKHTEKESKNKFALMTIDSIVDKLCEANDIKRENIKIHILEKGEVNAFAMPNDYLIIYSGLIEECLSPEELAGVLGHEIAHMLHQHVMEKMVREMGLSMLISISSGRAGGEVAKEAAKVLTSSAFDRNMEKEADISAVDYMINANIDPEPFAEFMSRLATKENSAMQYFSWASTHPQSRERAEYILEYSAKRKFTVEPLLSEQTWDDLQDVYRDSEL